MMPASVKDFDPKSLRAVINAIPGGKRTFSKITGISENSITAYLAGKISPSADRLFAISDVFEIPEILFVGEHTQSDYNAISEYVIKRTTAILRKDYEEILSSRNIPVGDASAFGEIESKYIEVPYPYNLIDAICAKHVDVILNDDLMAGLNKALDTLNEREQHVIRMRYLELKNLTETGKELNITKERVRQIEAKALRQLRHPARMKYIRLGLTGIEMYNTLSSINEEIKLKKDELKRLNDALDHAQAKLDTLQTVISNIKERQNLDGAFYTKPKPNELLYNELDMPIENLDFSVRTYNCTVRAGARTVKDLIVLAADEDRLIRVRNLGRKSLDEIYQMIRNRYDIDPRTLSIDYEKLPEYLKKMIFEN